MKLLPTLLILACIAAAGPAFAAKKPAPLNDKEHLCTDQDLVGGTWKLMSLTEFPHRKELNWFKTMPFHYLTFYQDHQYSYIASNAELTAQGARDEMRDWPRRGKHALQYLLSADGVLDLYFDRKLEYRYRCVYVDRAHDEFLPGDVKLDGYSTKYVPGKVYKLYRHWF